jgi:hypothetical protein
MFSALHQELKGYKDGFLLQTVHRPIIRDLVTLYDDVSELHRQMAEIGGVPAGESGGKAPKPNPLLDRIRQIATNMANNMHFLLEVLARLEVTVMPSSGSDKLDKLTQKAVNIEPAATPEEDGAIVRSVKCGFIWKEAVFRPEEVVIKKWKQAPAPAPASEKQTSEKQASAADKQPPESEKQPAASEKQASAPEKPSAEPENESSPAENQPSATEEQPPAAEPSPSAEQ